MSNPKTVLIVEDDPVFRRVLSFTVAKAGFLAETASNGDEGYQRLIQGNVDFLVTDLQMPVCSGIELLERLSAIEHYQRPTTILCTAKGLELDTEELLKKFGLKAIMHKPFSPRKLSELIASSMSVDGETVSTSPTIASLSTIAPAAASPETHSHG